jgi:hypothetical protein
MYGEHWDFWFFAFWMSNLNGPYNLSCASATSDGDGKEAAVVLFILLVICFFFFYVVFTILLFFIIRRHVRQYAARSRLAVYQVGSAPTVAVR